MSACLKDMGRLLRGSVIPMGRRGTVRILTGPGCKAVSLYLIEGTRECLEPSHVCRSEAGAEYTGDESRGERRGASRVMGRRPHRPSSTSPHASTLERQREQ